MRQLVERVPLAQKGDERGQLAVAELGSVLPFPVRRVYWIHGTKPGISRGFHAHKGLRQVFVCLAGSVRMMFTDGERREEFAFGAFEDALVVGPGLWRVMSAFSPDCVLMVLADREYDEGDYIRDFESFRRDPRHG
jgi:dTDP-4-dehydrorhamnose 3,5-epimerase-like enzyme